MTSPVQEQIRESENAVVSRPRETVQHWNPFTRVAFRFVFLYFMMYFWLSQMLTLMTPGFSEYDSVGIDGLWPIRNIISWVAIHLFHVTSALVITGSGSGDKTFDWVEAACFMIAAAAGTSIWSLLDRKRQSYIRLFKWFRVMVRFALGSTMLTYGFIKVVPLQMPFPTLTQLLEHFGNLSPMRVLWTSIGSAPAYESFTGCAELLGGILVMIPRTTTIGALICLADVTQVFALNMTYDVPVKLFSFHLILFALLVLTPDISKLVDLFFRNRPAAPLAPEPLFPTTRANRIAGIIRMIFITYLIGGNLYAVVKDSRLDSGGRAKPMFYGIWNVEELAVDGQVRPPLITDNDRWRRLVFDRNDRAALQRMDDSFAFYRASVDPKQNAVFLTKYADKNWKATFIFTQPATQELVLDGEMDTHKIVMKLHLVDHNKFLLLSRGFHWVQEYPF